MKMTPYAKLLKMGKEKAQELLAVPRAAEMKQKALHEISKLDVQMAEKENNIQQISSEYPINFDKLIQAQDDLGLFQRRKRQLESIVKEMFPESE
jgi:hypothetical protein